MPKFLEDKLRAEYGDNPSAIYGTMNKLGAMHGNKETAKGREMERKHEANMKTTKASAEPMREMRIDPPRPATESHGLHRPPPHDPESHQIHGVLGEHHPLPTLRRRPA